MLQSWSIQSWPTDFRASTILGATGWGAYNPGHRTFPSGGLPLGTLQSRRSLKFAPYSSIGEVQSRTPRCGALQSRGLQVRSKDYEATPYLLLQSGKAQSVGVHSGSLPSRATHSEAGAILLRLGSYHQGRAYNLLSWTLEPATYCHFGHLQSGALQSGCLQSRAKDFFADTVLFRLEAYNQLV